MKRSGSENGRQGSLEFTNQIGQHHWPAVPNPWAATIGALLHQFDGTQWWPEEKLRARQLEQARLVLAHACDATDFYRGFYDAAGIRPEDLSAWEDWQALPIVTRAELQAAGTGWHSTSVPPDHGDLRQHFTSGSSGRPLHSLSTNLSHLMRCALILRQHLWAGRDLARRVVFLAESEEEIAPEGRRTANWEAATQHVAQTGEALTLSLRLGVEALAERIAAFAPAYLIGYPTVIREIAAHSRATGLDLPSLEQVGTFGEALDPADRDAIAAEWNVGVYDLYSAMEAGPIAAQCPDGGHYHVQAESVIVEILHPDGTPCAPGETGRVVLTTLHNFAAPLIRYDIGDLAIAGSPCPCGRGLPVVERVLGRQRNMLRYPDGSLRWPGLNGRDLAAAFAEAGETGMPGIEQFQVVQHSPEEIEARIVSARPYSAAEEALLADYVRSQLGGHWQVRFSYPDHIARGPGGKFEDFISKCA